ncbi:acetolactate decarboxylase [Kordia jejudonensis]|uniref:acetolactate decarboxylase n=1 Tax=Kordia jejudonensis TaxID=1348245 RepID=UPI000629A52F|nr:acetolactate decarboxylase [Kordia jejudonensis]
MQTFKNILGIFFIIFIISCDSKTQKTNVTAYEDVKIVSAMKNVMWKGELQGKVNLDTISTKKGLYGIGPESYLTGEILINDGKSYVSRVTSDSTMTVEKNFDVEAPFFVYANVTEWTSVELPTTIKTIQDVEKFIDENTKGFKRPFVCKLIGSVKTATIHIQNLPKGSKVSSPKEAHQGQVNYKLKNEEVEIIGFFSTDHKGVFTHHDSNIHLHLITKDENKMGHVDAVEFDKMILYLPQK